MKGRTYRYMTEEPLFPFGYGLSYTYFKYSDLCVTEKNEDYIKVRVNVTNTGNMEADEKVQVYGEFSDTRTTTPNYQLCGIKSIHLLPDETKAAELIIDRYWLKSVLEDGSRVEPDGKICLHVGGHQPDKRSTELCGYSCEKIEL